MKYHGNRILLLKQLSRPAGWLTRKAANFWKFFVFGAGARMAGSSLPPSFLTYRRCRTQLTSFLVVVCLPWLQLSSSNYHTTGLGFANSPGRPLSAFTGSIGHRSGRCLLGFDTSSRTVKRSARLSVNMASKLPSEHALRTVIDVMSKHQNDAVVQAKGCEALLDLSSRNECTRMAIFALGGVDAVRNHSFPPVLEHE